MKLFRLIIKESHRVLILSYQRLLASILLTTIILTTAFAQDRLVPKSPIDDLASPYYRTLLKRMVLGGEEELACLFYYIVMPSAETGDSEYVLSADRENTLYFAKANHNIYDSMYLRQHDNQDTVNTSDLHIPDSVMNALNRLMESSVNASSFLFKAFGFDGTSYVFGNSLMAASCWSPGGRCGQLVTFWDKCCAAVEDENLDSIQALMPLCRNLTISFRKDYPNDFFDLEQRSIDYSSDSKYQSTLFSHLVGIEWYGTNAQRLEQQCKEFELAQGEELITFSKYLFIENLVDTKIILKPNADNRIDFESLRKGFKNDPQRFLMEHLYQPDLIK